MEAPRMWFVCSRVQTIVWYMYVYYVNNSYFEIQIAEMNIIDIAFELRCWRNIYELWKPNLLS